ncbi:MULTISPECIES: oligosaccharide flippase family protein [Exiguobacterium]|uniref:Polysaccharide biosynthesis protein n=1 Tax=Exiguobacterium sp. (strain ATCC BAA-1283 / AT1b) TaxID=360911 RepID=C4L729_EXISA|nr:oligosaccharide flippase family protein [Exiguobacterium sp. AT1b]ACQ70122.1 polysaccharide biosynthesis protein [Exiguobacterium sp. AT1b]
MSTRMTLDEAASNRKIKIGAVMSYTQIFFGILSGLIYTPWMIHEIGQASYGLYMLTISLISMFAMDFGLDAAVSRFMSKYMAEGDHERAGRFLGIAYKLFIAISLVLFLILTVVYFFLDSIYSSLTATELEQLKVLYVIAGLFIVVSFPTKPFSGILVSHEQFLFSSALHLAEKVGTVALMVTALLLGYGLYALVIVNALVGTIVLLIEYVFIRRKTLVRANFQNREKGIYRDIFSFTSWSTITLVAQRFVLNITPSLLGILAGSASIALFSVGMVIEGYVWTIAASLGYLFLPKVSRMLSRNDREAIGYLFVRIGRIQLYIVGLILASFFILGREFMHLWVGPDFTDSYVIALLLIAPSVITLTQDIGNTTLIAENKVKYRAFAALIVAAISMTLSPLLIPHFGPIGAAIAICIGNIVGLVFYMNVIYHRVLGLDILDFFRKCHLKLLPGILLYTLIGWGIQFFFPSSNWFGFGVKGIVLISIYAIIMWGLAFDETEKAMFRQVFAQLKLRILSIHHTS